MRSIRSISDPRALSETWRQRGPGNLLRVRPGDLHQSTRGLARPGYNVSLSRRPAPPLRAGVQWVRSISVDRPDLEGASLKKPVISIVDDDESVREGTLDLVRSMGFIGVAFPRAKDFLTSERRHTTSCLIADVRMPGMTGLELHDRLVQSGNTIPTILITAFPDDTARKRALSGGVICYLPKPFKQDELLACIRAALDRRNMRERGS